MKKLSHSLVLGIFSLLIFSSASAEEWKAYKFKEDSVKTTRIFSDDVIELDNGDTLDLVHVITSSHDYAVLIVEVILDDD